MPIAIRGKPRSVRDSEATRQALLASGAALFAERGFDGTSVDEIARRARVNKAMISYHFGGKEGLYGAILAAAATPAAERLRELATADIPPVEALERYVETFVELTEKNPHFPPMVLRELMEGGRLFDEAFFPHVLAIFGSIRMIIARGIALKVFRPVDPLVTHLAVVGSLLFFLVTEGVRARMEKKGILPAPRPLPKDFVAHLKDVTIRGLLAEPPRN
jgi:AcrR family transcriptional regulator